MVDVNSIVVEHVAPGLVQERATSGQFVILNVANNSQQTVQAWLDQVHALLLNWPLNSRCCLLHDLRYSELIMFNPLMQNAVEDIIKLRPDIERYIAFVLPEDCDHAMHLLTSIHQIVDDPKGLVYGKLFTGRQEAISWLLQRTK